VHGPARRRRGRRGRRAVAEGAEGWGAWDLGLGLPWESHDFEEQI